MRIDIKSRNTSSIMFFQHSIDHLDHPSLEAVAVWWRLSCFR